MTNTRRGWFQQLLGIFAWRKTQALASGGPIQHFPSVSAGGYCNPFIAGFPDWPTADQYSYTFYPGGFIEVTNQRYIVTETTISSNCKCSYTVRKIINFGG